MNPFEMVVLIVAIVMIARVVISKNRSRATADDPAQNARLRNEVQQLKDRVITLERIAVDKRSRLSDEIDALGRD